MPVGPEPVTNTPAVGGEISSTRTTFDHCQALAVAVEQPIQSLVDGGVPWP